MTGFSPYFTVLRALKSLLATQQTIDALYDKMVVYAKKSSAIKSNATAIWIIRNRDMFSGHFISSTIYPVIFQITIAIVSDYFVIAPYS